MNLKYTVVGDEQLILYLKNLRGGIKEELSKGMIEIGIHLEEKVKDKFGTYQEGWPKLKRETVIAKARRRGRMSGSSRTRFSSLTSSFNANMSGGDDPLSLFGDLEKSIRRKNTPMSTTIYSDNPYSAVHEYGYGPKNIPARSYMRLTLYQEEDDVVKIIRNRIGHLI